MAKSTKVLYLSGNGLYIGRVVSESNGNGPFAGGFISGTSYTVEDYRGKVVFVSGDNVLEAI